MLFLTKILIFNFKMKKIIYLSVALTGFLNLYSQEKTEKISTDYNKWSIDINAGLSRPTTPFTQGYFVEDLSFFHVDFGARYMFNPKFGLKADIGIDKYDQSKNSLPFKGEYYRANLQGVVNVGRILNFEDFSQRLNLQLHAGFGYAYLQTDAFDGKDEMTNVPIGLTAQFKISERVALNADFTMINNISQHYTFDGNTGGVDGPIIQDRGFNSTMYNATLGFSIYLGKNGKHADWVADNSELIALEQRVAQLEIMLNDTDRDGVADYVDVEPNTIGGITVDTKGRGIDMNSNGVPDEVESYIERMKKGDTNISTKGGQSIEDLINGGYINVYFDTDSSKPKPESMDAVNFVIQYLRNKPNASVDLIGYADEIGNSEYNKSLSVARSTYVKDIITKAGINASRLNTIGQGEDNSVDANSKEARSLVRRVTFKLK